MKKNKFNIFVYKSCLFGIRIAITIIAVILVKSGFLCWWFNSFTLQDFGNNVFSLSSALIGIGCFTSNLLANLLNHTPFNVNIKELWDILWFSKPYSNSKFNPTYFDPFKLPLGDFCGKAAESSTTIKYIPAAQPELIYSSSMNSSMDKVIGIGNGSGSDKGNGNLSNGGGSNNGNGVDGGSSVKNYFASQIEAINLIIEERKKLIADLQKFSTNNSQQNINNQMDIMLNLVRKNQDLRVNIIMANKNHLSVPMMMEIDKSFNIELKGIYDEYLNAFLSLNKNDPNSSKKEFDLNNGYLKKRTSILENLVQKMQREIKNNHPNHYSEWKKEVLKKYQNEIDSSQAEIKKVQKELGILVNSKKGK